MHQANKIWCFTSAKLFMYVYLKNFKSKSSVESKVEFDENFLLNSFFLQIS